MHAYAKALEASALTVFKIWLWPGLKDPSGLEYSVTTYESTRHFNIAVKNFKSPRIKP